MLCYIGYARRLVALLLILSIWFTYPKALQIRDQQARNRFPWCLIYFAQMTLYDKQCLPSRWHVLFKIYLIRSNLAVCFAIAMVNFTKTSRERVHQAYNQGCGKGVDLEETWTCAEERIIHIIWVRRLLRIIESKGKLALHPNTIKRKEPTCSTRVRNEYLQTSNR